MSTDETDRLKPLQQGGVCVLVSVRGEHQRQKKGPSHCESGTGS